MKKSKAAKSTPREVSRILTDAELLSMKCSALAASKTFLGDRFDEVFAPSSDPEGKEMLRQAAELRKRFAQGHLY